MRDSIAPPWLFDSLTFKHFFSADPNREGLAGVRAQVRRPVRAHRGTERGGGQGGVARFQPVAGYGMAGMVMGYGRESGAKVQ